jgi:methenyltetrahydromethanopterin cyclohydrolase
MFLLIIATSARMLTQAARNGQFIPLVIDCYADQDTQQLAAVFRQVASLAKEDLQAACAFFKQQYGVNYCIYGSGFEAHADSLVFLAEHFSLIGNSPQTFLALHTKASFFNTLQQQQIPYPDVCFSPPLDSNTWLIKSQLGQGGIGVTFFSKQHLATKTEYYQRYIKGIPMSVLFVANGNQARIIGFNRQWTTPLNKQPFVFSGIIGSVFVSHSRRQAVHEWLQKLTRIYALQGLNSLDFIRADNHDYVLEINPRPPASMQLYQADLLAIHIQACFGHLEKLDTLSMRAAYQIVYAKQTRQLPAAMVWHENCVDIPSPGAIIRTGQPICSMISRGKNLHRLVRNLRLTEHFIFQQIQQPKIMEYTASINKLSQPLVRELIDNADKLRLKVQKLDNGCTVIDAGISVPGGLEAGRIITEICLGGLGTVSISHSTYTENWPLTVTVYSSNPLLACLGSQYAGWSLAHGKYYALGSGPARAMATKVKADVVMPVEELYKELAYQDSCDSTVLVIENDKLPPLEIVEKVATACGVTPENLTIIITPTSSLAGGVQVVGRVLEVALHKAHALHFPLENIVDGSGSAPICPPHPDFVQAMGRTNDAILFAGQVHLFVKGSDEEAEKLANALPSSTSKDYGKPFAQIFKEYQYDFFKIDPLLFSPASVIVTAVESGRSFRAGKLDNDLLNLSFA